jgi:hypothetical protein
MTNFWNLLNEKGAINTESFEAAGDAMIDQLIWWTDALKEARSKDAAV